MNRWSNRGFTLVELLIGVLIFSIVIFTLFSSFDAFVSSSRAVSKDIIRNEGVKHALARISLDLESLFIVLPPRYSKPEFNSEPDPYGFLGNIISVKTRPFSQLSFSSLAHAATAPENRKGVARIQYFVGIDKQGLFNLYRSDFLQPLIDKANEKKICSTPILCRDIIGFEVKFFDLNGDEQESWDSDLDEYQYTIPIRVDIKITCQTNDNPQVFQTAIFIAPGRDPIK